MEKSYRNIKGQKYSITDDNVILKSLGNNINFKRSEISSVELRSSIFDNLPIVQKSVRIKLKGGRKYDLKALSRKDAKEVYNELIK